MKEESKPTISELEGRGADEERLRSEPRPAPLREGVDYYTEGRFMVFTADFLRRRGYCCQSGCRHCPYGYDPAESGKENR